MGGFQYSIIAACSVMTIVHAISATTADTSVRIAARRIRAWKCCELSSGHKNRLVKAILIALRETQAR